MKSWPLENFQNTVAENIYHNMGLIMIFQFTAFSKESTDIILGANGLQYKTVANGVSWTLTAFSTWVIYAVLKQ